jgi:hypothetical protein
MDQNQQTHDSMSFAVAIGAGVASALLLIIAFKGTALAMTLTYMAPLPIMIAALGFGSRAGLVAALVGSLAVAAAGLIYGRTLGATGSMLLPSATAAFGFATTIGFPSWWLGHILLRPRADGASSPTGPALVWTVFLVAAPVLLTLIVASVHYGSYDAAAAAVAAKIEPVLQDSLVKSGAQLPADFDVKNWAAWIPRAMPAFAAGSAVIMMGSNLWLAGKVADMSQRLPQPWPDLRFELALPRWLVGAFAGAVVVAFLGGLIGAAAFVVAVAIGAAFSLLGLAVAHALLRNAPGRMGIFFALYLAMALFFPFPLLLLIPLGLAETLMSLRARKAASSSRKI